MQETRTFTIYSQDCLDSIASGDDDCSALLQSELEGEEDLIEGIIGPYHESGEVSYEIADIEVNTLGKGHFEVDYIAHKYSGCRDIDLDEDDSMVIAIDVNLQTGETTLTGEYIPDRDPDTY